MHINEINTSNWILFMFHVNHLLIMRDKRLCTKQKWKWLLEINLVYAVVNTENSHLSTNSRVAVLTSHRYKHSHAVESALAAHSESECRNHQHHYDALYDHHYNDATKTTSTLVNRDYHYENIIKILWLQLQFNLQNITTSTITISPANDNIQRQS